MTSRFVLRQPEGILTQGFGENANSSYSRMGLKGHPALDWTNGFRSEVPALVDGEVYATRQPTSDPLKYTAVYQIIDAGKYSYEVSYGHFDEIYVKRGSILKVGDIMGLEGNRGEVYTNGRPPTLEERKKGAGSHVHGLQTRKCIRVKERTKPSKWYLQHSNGYLKRDGYFYEILDYDNGFNGCQNPELFYELDDGIVFKILRLLGILK